MNKEKSICRELKVLDNMMGRKADAMVSGCFDPEITNVQGQVIGFLRHNEDRPIYQKDVEAEFSITRATTSKMLSLMERNGLIRRLPVAADGRLKELRPTEKALECGERVHRRLMEFEKIVTAGLTEEEKQVFLQVLKKMQNNLAAADEEERSE